MPNPLKTINNVPLGLRAIITLIIILGSLAGQNYIVSSFENNLNQDVQSGLAYIDRDNAVISSLNSLYTNVTKLVKLKEEFLSIELMNIETNRLSESITFDDVLNGSNLLTNKIVSRDKEEYVLPHANDFITLEKQASNYLIVQQLIDNQFTQVMADTNEYIATVSEDTANIFANANILSGSFGRYQNISSTFSQKLIELDTTFTNVSAAKSVTNMTYYGTFISRVAHLQNVVLNFISNIANLYAQIVAAPFSLVRILIGNWNQIMTVANASLSTDLATIDDAINGSSLRAEENTTIALFDDILLSSSTGLLPVLNSITNYLLDFVPIIGDVGILINQDLPTVFSQVSIQLNNIISQIELESSAFRLGLIEYSKVTNQFIRLLLQVSSFIIVLLILIFMVPILWSTIKITRRLSSGFEGISNKDLAIKRFTKYDGAEFGRIERGFDVMVDDLQNIILQLVTSSEGLASIAQTMAASAQEASASINQVSETVATISIGTNQQSESMSKISESLSHHLVEVETVSEEIVGASSLVRKVAKQTNILGLNASIEAAKAGHFGGGFSVVAENVRELSDSTKKSADNISQLIEEIGYKIRRTVQDVLEDVTEMRDIAENNAAGTEEVNASTSEQVSMMAEISEQASEVARISAELNELITEFKF